MKAAVYYNNTDIRIEERPLPDISGGEILVKMEASGICGTDVMQWYRIKKAPRILGHEMAGKITAIGDGVQKFKKGDRVFVSHHVPCYNCHHCTLGNYTACESLHTGNYDPGGFSEFIRVPEQNVKYGTILLPKNVTFEHASMIEPLGCTIAGQNLLELNENHSVLIIGAGVSGILHIQIAKLKKTKVIAADINDYKLKKALDFGADHAINANKYSTDELKSKNSGRLADIVIVCTASEQAVIYGLSSVNRKGKILFFAIPQNNISIPSVQFWRDEISVKFSYGASPDDLKEALKLIENRSVNINDMITHRVNLSSIGQGFRIVSEDPDSLKVVVVPDSVSDKQQKKA